MGLLSKISIRLFNAHEHSVQLSLDSGSQIDRSAILENVYANGLIHIGAKARLNRGVYLRGNIEIGAHTAISGPNTDLLSAKNEIKIGKFCSIARNVSFQEYFHRTDHLTTSMIHQNFFDGNYEDIVSKGSINVGNDVWIGTHCVILSGVTIGDGAVIAANSVVTSDVPPYAVVGGSPAKFIKNRFDQNVIDKLNELKWWDWSEERLKKNKHLFESPVTIESLDSIL